MPRPSEKYDFSQNTPGYQRLQNIRWYNFLMIIRNAQPPQPILAISPPSLDFGLVNYAAEPTEGHGIATLTVTNDGDRMLVGRIAIQVSWVSVYPPDFRLSPGESSDHLFTVRRVNQLTWNSGHKLGSEFVALINSNGGSETIGGYYYIDNKEIEKKKSPFTRRILGVVALAVLITAAILYFVLYSDRQILEMRGTENVSALYTQLAETILSDIALNEPTPSRTAPGIVLPIANIPGGAPSGEEATFTPWPQADYPDPESFVRSYYDTLNARNYSLAWWMLSEKVQIACCYNKGVNPIDYFTTVWSEISDIEVVYAYLQNPGENPAVLNIAINYTNEDGTKSQYDLRVEVISSSTQRTLLIDLIQ